MPLDVHTLFVIAVLVLAVAGLLLLLTWLQNRNVVALAMWAAAFMIQSVGVALISVRGAIPDLWSITIANAIIAAGYGIMWGGARNFNGRPTSLPLVLAGAAIWLLACQVDAFFVSPWARAGLMSAIIVAYSVLSAWEFWQGRDEGLMSRLPIIVFLLVHAAVVIIRIPLAGSLPVLMATNEIRLGWWTFIIFEALFFSFCVAYLLGGMARERMALWYKHAALIDPLTGADNRRAFLERGERLLRRAAVERTPAVLLMFDLDNFKSINDAFGHHAGDRALIGFCKIATAALRPGDPFARLGGEEFAALLLNTQLNAGLAVAERIRANFEAAAPDLGAGAFAVTVSVGVAATVGQDQGLAALMMEADRALYRAKEKGRNRVEHVRDELQAQIESAMAAPYRILR
jgi:diguanylate cyclase (GGDEF)-like protein